MANTKIDRIKLNGSDTVYDIDLPPDATPSISSLTVSGIKNAAMVSTDANGKLTKSNLPAAFEQISVIDKTIQYNDNIEVTEVYLSCEGMENYYKWDRLVFSAPGSPAASNIKYYYNYMGQKTELTPTNASALNSVLDSYGESIVVAINRDESNPTITYLPNSLVLGRGYYSNKDGGDVFTYYVYDSPQGSMPALREISPDTHFTTGLYVGKADEKSNSATTNGNTYLKLFDNDTKRAQHLINGGGATMVTSNASGTIEIATPIKTLDTTSGSGLGDGRSENIAGSGTIYLHKVAKTGSYNDLVNKPTIPTNLVTIDTEQRISGKKYFENDVNFGKWVNPVRQVSDAPTKLNLMSSAQTNAGFFDTVMFAGAGDWLYLGHLKPDFSIRASFRGTGDENDTYSANLDYTHGTLNALTDWDYQSGWMVRPTKVSTTTPAIIQIKFTRQLYTDVLRLIITGHNLNDTGSGSAYSGFLDDYTIEVCTNYTNDTWTTVVNRTNASDSIGAGLMYSLQTGSYTPCYGIRLKITKCHVTGKGYAFIKISSMQLRDYRPGIKFPDCLGAISQGGGDVWGELYTKNNLVTHNVLPYATNQSYIGNANSQYWSIYSHDFYENGTALSDKYLNKGSDSTNDNQVVYNPVELKKGLTGTGAFVWNGNYVDTFKVNVLSSGSITEVFKLSQLTATLKANSFTLTSSTSNMVLDPNTGGSISITGGSKDKYFSFASATEGTFLTTGDKGIANGVASLGSDGKVPASQLAVGSISSESIVSICI